MSEATQPQNRLEALLQSGALDRTRRNHGLEHATLHVLAGRNPHRSMAGHSDPDGFWLVGDLTTEEVKSALDEALGRLQAGEADLAVHPNCGTNYVVGGILAGGAAALTMLGGGRKLSARLERLPIAMLAATLALMIAQPAGYAVQARITTSGAPGNLRVAAIYPARYAGMTAHRILTEG
jgi:hypothetical protein